MKTGEIFQAPMRNMGWAGPNPEWAFRWQFPEPVSYCTAGLAVKAAVGKLRASGHWLSPVPCYCEGNLCYNGMGNPAEGCGEFMAAAAKESTASADWILATADPVKTMRDADGAYEALGEGIMSFTGDFLYANFVSWGVALMPARLLCAMPEDVRLDSTVRHFVKGEDGEYGLLNSFF